MAKTKLTALAIERLTPPDKGQVDYFDAAMPAFGVRVSVAGSRTFFVMTRIHGKLVRLTIGRAKLKDDGPGLSLKEARHKAGEWIELAERGIDPRQVKALEKQDNRARSQNTFETVGERFLHQHVKARLAAKTEVEYVRVLQGADTREWRNRPVADITRADVRVVLDAIVERGSLTAANNTLAYLRKFFNWCAEKDVLDIPPTDRIKAPAPKVVGERTLDERECGEVWKAFDGEDKLFGDLLKLFLLTGQRRSEVAGMRAGEFKGLDGDNPTWEIPANRTKNKRAHLVPLSPLAASIIRDRPVIGDEGFLFSTTGKSPVSGLSRVKKRIDDKLFETRKKNNEPPMPPWRYHDLRRTMVTMMNEHLAIPPHVVEACVNHISGGAKAGVAGVYNKALYLRERRKAFEAWSLYVMRMKSGKS
ncbi:MAG: site-specific integrase [Alphaproteobacteria bacterium]|nr:site-specific integrase [Alphaproteobacteria bacterium]